MREKSILQQKGRGFWHRPEVKVFLTALLTAFVIFLPFIIYNRGMFTYYGDFNVQQIPFYMHAQDYLQNGNFGWDWYTDLGSNFLASYAFYLLGSPFFWVTLLFPTAAVPYLMAPLLMLKFAFIALTGYAFIRRFTRTADMAVIGGLLYAFSGFNIYNIFFNHFHEAVLVFPLLLLALEEEMTTERRGVFALAAAACAAVNYYFFFGQVIFTLLYFGVRCFSPDIHMTWKKFGKLFLEAVLGVGISAVILLPGVLGILANDRITERLYGHDILLYNRVQRYGLILESMFFPPDMPARPNFFPDSNSKWSSVSAYLPLFGMVGVITFLKTHEKHWIKRMLGISFLFAMVPILNSLFSGLNWNYYARWFYMPLLLMSLATVLTFEEYADDGNMKRFTAGFVISGAVILVGIVIGIMPKKTDGEVVWFDAPRYPVIFWAYIAAAVLFLAIAFVLLRFFWKHPKGQKILTLTLCICVTSYSWMLLTWGASNGDGYERIHDYMIEGADNFRMPDETMEFYRVNSHEITDNAEMFWGMPAVQAFQSVVPGSIQAFYAEIGYDRNVASRPEPTYYGLNGLLSTLFYIQSEEQPEEDLPAGFGNMTMQNGFKVYVNNHFVPMGFAYDGIVDRYVMDGTAEKYRDRLMLHGLYLEEEDIEKYGHLLHRYTREEIPNLTDKVYFADCAAREAQSCDSFTFDSHSFRAEISLPEDNLVFFSVPWESGWRVSVNGEEREVIRANVGFMAVKADAGENEIIFTYRTPGLAAGSCITVLSAGILALWCFVRRGQKIKKTKEQNNE